MQSGTASTGRSTSSAWTGATWARSWPPPASSTELKNLCVWNKTNGGMGTFYRSKHELVFVFKEGSGAAHQQLRAGRERPLPHQRLGLSPASTRSARPHGRAARSSDGEAGAAGGGCDQGLLEARWDRAGPVRRQRHDPDRGGEDRSRWAAPSSSTPTTSTPPSAAGRR